MPEAQLPEYVTNMVRRPVPHDCVVVGSTPVVAFGDPQRAEVATLGINPSAREFVEGGRLLSGPARRLATLASVGATATEQLTDAQVRDVMDDCAVYFSPDRNPYMRWFDPLDRLMVAGLGVSYRDGTACHLDLVQWATDPVWGKLPPETRSLLLADGVPHLREQLRYANTRLVLLNGRQVLNHVEETGLAVLEPLQQLHVGAVRCTLMAGEGSGVRFLGWSTNLQSSFGVSLAFRERLAAWLAEMVREREADGTEGADAWLDDEGHLRRGTTVTGKAALHALLERWLAASTAPTIGDVGTFGGSPCVIVALDVGIAVLNADTKRSAVAAYVAEAARRGADLSWFAIPNRRGRVNKLTFHTEGADQPGWYCYLREPLAGAGEV